MSAIVIAMNSMPNMRTNCLTGNLHKAGTNPETGLVEIVELVDHPWFVGVQFHPEFLSRPMRPHPLFREFIGAALSEREGGQD